MTIIPEKPGVCESAGVVLENKKHQGEFLAVYRKINPVGWGLPSCHTVLERSGIKLHDPVPADVARKVIWEEFGVRLINIYHLLEQMVMLDYPCRYGYRIHSCLVLGVKSYEGEPKILRPEKHERVEFVSAAQLAEFEKSEKTDPSWYKFLLKNKEIREVIWKPR